MYSSMNKLRFVAALASVCVLGTTLITSCFSKPAFTGGQDGNNDAATDAATDAAPRACGAGLQPLPNDIIITAQQFFSVEDLNRDGLDDLALMAEDAQSGQHVFVYFGADQRTIDIHCWDHQIVATGFEKIGGVKIEPGWYGGEEKGTLFIFGHAQVEADLRIEAHVVDGSQNFDAVVAKVLPDQGPIWNDGGVHSAFLVWRYVGTMDQELLFGGDAKLFSLSISNIGFGTSITRVTSEFPIVQLMDISGTELLVDTGINAFNVNRNSYATDMTFPNALPGGGGSSNGKIFAAQEWMYQGNASVAVRVPQFATEQATTRLQLLARNEVITKALSGVDPVGVRGPFITGAAASRNVGQAEVTLAAIVSTFDGTGAPLSHKLVVEKGNAESMGAIIPEQEIKLKSGRLPVVTAGAFSVDAARNFLVIYPRRTASEPGTSSVCYQALGGCLAECGANVCAAQ